MSAAAGSKGGPDAPEGEERLVEHARALAADSDVDVELAAGDLLEAAGADQDALARARAVLERDASGGAAHASTERALEIVIAALQVGYEGQ